jgi:hypothetical protein
MNFFYKYKYFVAILFFILIVDFTMFLFGQPFINKNGIVQLWCGAVQSSCNSQDISDWYTPSHFLHGVVFFWFLYFIFRKIFKTSVEKINYFKIFLISLFLESFWEILENTPFIINKYREATIAFDYSGDSILNSTFDILFMTLGFFVCKKVWLENFTFCIYFSRAFYPLLCTRQSDFKYNNATLSNICNQNLAS